MSNVKEYIIDLVKNEPCIWKLNDKSFRAQQMKNEAFKVITNCVNQKLKPETELTVEEVKTIWNNCRRGYLRAMTTKKNTYYLASKMDFLTPYLHDTTNKIKNQLNSTTKPSSKENLKTEKNDLLEKQAFHESSEDELTFDDITKCLNDNNKSKRESKSCKRDIELKIPKTLTSYNKNKEKIEEMEQQILQASKSFISSSVASTNIITQQYGCQLLEFIECALMDIAEKDILECVNGVLLVIQSSLNQKNNVAIQIAPDANSIDDQLKSRSKPQEKVSIISPIESTCKNEAIDLSILKKLNLSVQMVERDDITVASTLIGSGRYGTVHKGIWCHTPVAIKLLHRGFNDKYIYREITAMDRIRHSNFISIMAFCLDVTHCYIIMEFFKSFSLRRVIFDKKIAPLFELDYSKRCIIAKQICAAINYLHSSSHSIIHQDIKPENILVNEDTTVKICDMGLSSLVGIPTILESTDGQNKNGTPMYMAPEILLRNESGSKYSDVWSVGCVLAELFQQTLIWPVSSIDGLTEIFTKKDQPDLSGISEDVKIMVSPCFNYLPKERLSCCDLLQFFEEQLYNIDDSDY